jgi:hypothetical protein
LTYGTPETESAKHIYPYRLTKTGIEWHQDPDINYIIPPPGVAAARSSCRPLLCDHASLYASPVVRIRDTSGKTRPQYEHITKGQADGPFAASVQRTAHIHCPLSSRKCSLPHWFPIVDRNTLRRLPSVTPKQWIKLLPDNPNVPQHCP